MVGYGLISLACVGSFGSLFPCPVPLEETRLLTLVLPYSQVRRETVHQHGASHSVAHGNRGCRASSHCTAKLQHAACKCTIRQHVTCSAHPASFWAHAIAHSSVRSIFAGHTNSKAGYSYRIWSLFRVLCFVAIAISPLSAIRTVVFVILLVCSCGILRYRIPRRCAATPHRRHHARCWRRCSSKA